MDKRKVYGFVQDQGYFCLSVGGCGEDRETCLHAEDCKEHALVDPAALAQVEVRLAAAEELLAKKDAALQEVLSECVVSLDDPRLKYVEVQMSKGVLEAVRDALAFTLTPVSIAQQAEDARIGRAVSSVDKRKVYGYFAVTWRGEPPVFMCGNPTQCTPIGEGCEDCKEHALVDPAELAELEKQAARVPELERENERLNGLAAKAQGLYEVVTDLSESTHHFCEEFCNKLKPDGTCEPDDCPVWIAQHKAKASLVCYLCFRDGHNGILCPIVNSEEDVAKAEEDARIGKAVREWRNSIPIPPGLLGFGYRQCLEKLDEVIAEAKAREATKDV